MCLSQRFFNYLVGSSNVTKNNRKDATRIPAVCRIFELLNSSGPGKFRRSKVVTHNAVGSKLPLRTHLPQSLQRLHLHTRLPESPRLLQQQSCRKLLSPPSSSCPASSPITFKPDDITDPIPIEVAHGKAARWASGEDCDADDGAQADQFDGNVADDAVDANVDECHDDDDATMSSVDGLASEGADIPADSGDATSTESVGS
jgi:hypothetical protein